jgi:hypothetical protein
MTTFKIPYAFDEARNLVTPEAADKKGNYFCPRCQATLILRQGPIHLPHFAHKTSDTCTRHAIIRQVAKRLLTQCVAAWKEDRSPAPLLKRCCQICDAPIQQPLPDKVEKAVMNYRLATGEQVDVALLVKGQAAAVIEINVTQPAGMEETRSLALPFIVLDGDHLTQVPTTWQPLVDRFKPLVCVRCRQNFRRFQHKASQLARQTGLTIPPSYYRYGIGRCWKCHRQILVFTWPGQKLFSPQAPSRPPIPATLRHRFSKTIRGKYWANTCPYCRAIQGDFFLHCEPGGTFCGVNCEEDTPQAFKTDLLKIAFYASRYGYT